MIYQPNMQIVSTTRNIINQQSEPVVLRLGTDVYLGRIYGMGTDALSLVMKCPRCNGQLDISNELGIQLHPISPRVTVLPWGQVIQEFFAVSVSLPFKCLQPSLNGKGYCGFPMAVQDGHIIKNVKWILDFVNRFPMCQVSSRSVRESFQRIRSVCLI